MTEKEMWSKYCLESKIDENTPHEAWPFCGGGPLADELAALVLSGIKTATSSSFIAYEMDGSNVPQIGCLNVILYDNGEAAGVIKDTKVSLVPFSKVSEEHAYKEGEERRNLEDWRHAHKKAFTPDYEAAGKPFDENGLCVLEEFELVYPVANGCQP